MFLFKNNSVQKQICSRKYSTEYFLKLILEYITILRLPSPPASLIADCPRHRRCTPPSLSADAGLLCYHTQQLDAAGVAFDGRRLLTPHTDIVFGRHQRRYRRTPSSDPAFGPSLRNLLTLLPSDLAFGTHHQNPPSPSNAANVATDEPHILTPPSDPTFELCLWNPSLDPAFDSLFRTPPLDPAFRTRLQNTTSEPRLWNTPSEHAFGTRLRNTPLEHAYRTHLPNTPSEHALAFERRRRCYQ